MKGMEMKYLDLLIERYPALSRERENILAMYETLVRCYESGGKLLIAGNGGSAADAEHITGELMKGFMKKREVPEETARAFLAVDPELGKDLAGNLQQGLQAICLSCHEALNTAFMNDCKPDLFFAQQVYGYGRPGDVFLGISTSGNSKNVLYAATAAKALGLTTAGLLGRDGGKLLPLCDYSVVVPEQETFKIQELHLPVYHALCQMLEEHFF